jgi:outer membrane biosynthesis protein TonB
MHSRFALCIAALTLLCSCAAPPQAPSVPNLQIERLREEQYRLLAQVRYELAMLEPRVRAAQGDDPESIRFRERYKRLKSQFTSIEEEVQATESGDTVYVSADAKNPLLAAYYERLRARIEQAGTSNFPVAEGQSVYGTASVLLTLNSDGVLKEVEVIQSSSEVLRSQSQLLLQSLSPFEPLPSDVALKASRVVIVTSFRYVRAK